MRGRTVRLSCPVPDGPSASDTCGADITVEAWPGYAGSFNDPPEGPEVRVLHATRCTHLAELESGDYDDQLLDQLIEKESDAP
jgi:hypothetical protein